MHAGRRRALLWAPWAVLAAAGAAFVIELGREVAGTPLSGTSSGAVALMILLQLLPAGGALFAAAVCLAAVQQHTETGALSPPVQRLLYWTPRTAVLLFAAFLGLFALDVFQPGRGAIETLLALLLHLIPSFVLLATAAAAWRWPRVGAVVLTVWSVWYLATFWGRFFLSVYVDLALLPFLLGVLFELNWQYRAILRRGMDGGAAPAPRVLPPAPWMGAAGAR